MLRIMQVAIAAAAAVVVGASAQAQAPQGYPADYARIVEAAKKEGRLVVYATTDAAGRSSRTTRVAVMLPVTVSGRMDTSRVTRAWVAVGETSVSVDRTSASRTVESTARGMEFPRGRRSGERGQLCASGSPWQFERSPASRPSPRVVDDRRANSSTR